jgi:prepilin-type N-terminal cleavage/methylation domain-containing protein
MRATIRRAVEAHKAQREENGEAGFSLIELIIVVVILGILAAIAIPIFLGLQGQAEQSAQDSVAGNAASQAASDLAQDKDVNEASFAALTDDGKYDISITPSDASIDNFCITVTGGAGTPSTAGPACETEEE